MRAVVQRVNYAKVSVDNEIKGNIKQGLLVFLGVSDEDDFSDVKYLSDKIVNLRIFEDADEKMNLSLGDVKGELLIVSQFTLYGDCRKGRRPNFTEAGNPRHAEKLYNDFVLYCKELNFTVQNGVFGANMKVELENDGPVTLLLDSKKLF